MGCLAFTLSHVGGNRTASPVAAFGGWWWRVVAKPQRNWPCLL